MRVKKVIPFKNHGLKTGDWIIYGSENPIIEAPVRSCKAIIPGKRYQVFIGTPAEDEFIVDSGRNQYILQMGKFYYDQETPELFGLEKEIYELFTMGYRNE